MKLFLALLGIVIGSLGFAQDSDYVDREQLRIYYLFNLGSYDEALTALDDFIFEVRSNSQDLFWAYTFRAGVYSYKAKDGNNENLSKALEDYRRAIRIDSTAHMGWVGAGGALVDLKRYEDARYYLEESLKYGVDKSTYLNLGVLCARTDGSYLEAITYYDLAIDLDSSYAQAFANRAKCKYELGDDASAVLDCDKAIFFV